MTKLIKKVFSIVFLIVVSNLSAQPNAGNLQVSRLFTNNMVLQRGMKVPVWGWADAGGIVKVEFNGQTIQTVVNDSGKWMLKLEAMKAGGPFEMTVSGAKKLVLNNVMIGDVWLCGGQSNMAWVVRKVKNSRSELKNANYPRIRLFNCPILSDQTPREKLVSGRWQEASSNTVAIFSAVGYFFGRDLFRELNVPIGLISSNVGGTAIELWIPRDELRQDPGSKKAIEKFEQQCRDPETDKKLKAYKDCKEKVSSYIKGTRYYMSEAWTKPGFDGKDWESFDSANPEAETKISYALLNIRKTIDIKPEWAGKDMVIHINYPMVYGHSKLFFNGSEVKRMPGWYGHHIKRYLVKGELVKPGKAVIAEHLFSYKYGKDFQRRRGLSYITLNGKDNKILLSGIWQFKPLDKFKAQREPMHANHRKALNGLYNAMIHPLMPFAIKGVIWYQGEANAAKAYHYRKLLPLLINSWRKAWGQGDFPFLIVQLANYGTPAATPGDSSWAELREAQFMTAENIPHCGIATAIDIGEAKNIHPINKQDVGARLSLVARKLVYGEDIVHSGPVYQSMSLKVNKLILKFKNIGSGLEAKGKKLKGFSIAGKNRKFLWADAVIDGNSVIVSNENVEKPVAVRYAWARNPQDANLYNKEGLPAFPFRTDDWPLSTKK